MTEKKLVRSRAKVPEVGCVVVKIRNKATLEALAKNLETSKKIKQRKQERKNARELKVYLKQKLAEERKEYDEAAKKGQLDQCDNELKHNPMKVIYCKSPSRQALGE